MSEQARGSVLLEQLLAISVLGILVVSVFSVLTTGSLAAQMAQKLSLASGLAAEKLEEISARCEGSAEASRRPFDPKRFPGYQWKAAIAEVAPGLCQTTVTVWWPERGRERSVSLTTLVRRQEDP